MATTDLDARIKELGPEQSLTIPRDEFRSICDEEDKVVYLTIARRMAKANKRWVTIEEDNLIFGPPPEK
ncbi:MAG TPA: hypothetical protein DCZ13_14905 [Porticoccaceae bacterium]|nr:hypothetical protein [Porticoccaceae bacterium]